MEAATSTPHTECVGLVPPLTEAPRSFSLLFSYQSQQTTVNTHTDLKTKMERESKSDSVKQREKVPLKQMQKTLIAEEEVLCLKNNKRRVDEAL